jgi:hypothetical protein
VSGRISTVPRWAGEVASVLGKRGHWRVNTKEAFAVSTKPEMMEDVKTSMPDLSI